MLLLILLLLLLFIENAHSSFERAFPHERSPIWNVANCPVLCAERMSSAILRNHLKYVFLFLVFARQSWKTSAHACSWLFLAHFRSFSPLNDVVLLVVILAITTFDKMELDECWEESNSTRSLWHTELISRECWLFSNSKAGKSWEALLDSHSANWWVGLSDVQSTLLEQD